MQRAASPDRSFSAEGTLELLLSAAAGRPAHLSQLCTAVEAWDAVFHSALLHGAESYLYRCLIDAGVKLPAGLRQRTERRPRSRDGWQSPGEATPHDVLRIL